MKKNKILVLSIIFQLVLHSALLAQIDDQRKLINELFYNVPSSNKRSDIKAILNSIGLSLDFEDRKAAGQDYMSMRFYDNPLLRSLGVDNNLWVYFKPDGTIDQIEIKINYPGKDRQNSRDQFNELVEMFGEVSYKRSHVESIQDGNKNLIGMGYKFYSSSNKREENRGYLSVSHKKHNESYLLEIHFYPTNLN